MIPNFPIWSVSSSIENKIVVAFNEFNDNRSNSDSDSICFDVFVAYSSNSRDTRWQIYWNKSAKIRIWTNRSRAQQPIQCVFTRIHDEFRMQNGKTHCVSMWTKYLKSTRQMELKIDKWQRACLPSIWNWYWLDKNECEPWALWFTPLMGLETTEKSINKKLTQWRSGYKWLRRV